MIDEKVKVSYEYKNKLLASKNELLKQFFYFFSVMMTSTFSFGNLHFIFEHLKSKTRKLVF